MWFAYDDQILHQGWPSYRTEILYLFALFVPVVGLAYIYPYAPTYCQNGFPFEQTCKLQQLFLQDD